MTTHYTHDEQSDINRNVADYTSDPINFADDSSPFGVAAPLPSVAGEETPMTDVTAYTAAPSEVPEAPAAPQEGDASDQPDIPTTDALAAAEAVATHLQDEAAHPEEGVEQPAQELSQAHAPHAPLELHETPPPQETAGTVGAADAQVLGQSIETPIAETSPFAEMSEIAQAEVPLPAAAESVVAQAADVPDVPATMQAEATVREEQSPEVDLRPILEAIKQEEEQAFDIIAAYQQAAEEIPASLSQLEVSEIEHLSASSSAPSLLEERFLALIEQAAGEAGAASETGQATTTVQHDVAFTSTIVHEEAAPEAAEAMQNEPPATEIPTPQPFERPVSPLLRPASRLRVPRHGSLRQYEQLREQSREQAQVQPAAQVPQESAPTAEQEQAEAPRPARRYRFDRPVTNNGRNVPPAQPPLVTPSRIEEQKEAAGRVAPLLSATPEATRQDTTIPTETQPKAPAPSGTASTNGMSGEKQSQSAQSAASSSVANGEGEESDNTTLMQAPAHEHDRRRRHLQERGRDKEQAPSPAAEPPQAALPAEEVATSAMEQFQPTVEEVAPEDLPPLEYADLQKATGRRRRRHRASATPFASNAPATPPAIVETPKTEMAAPQNAAQTAPMPIAQATPMMPSKTNGQSYTIVSGYTVSQMNQGNDTQGPFMGPEPSPARGSVLSRDGRTVRAETQRAPIYPARSTDNNASPASIQQLASVLSQAIQTQTDRMVAELRRTNQTPTNVSVSLPPFPSTERVGVFVDVANLLYSARTMRVAVDFGKLLDFLRGNRRLVRAHAYCPTSPQAGDEQMFLQAVKGLGYRITTKNYKTFASGAKKADLDLDLCMDVVRLVDGHAVDCVVLVSGDSDFMPMLDYCSDHGVRVEVAAFDEAMSATLRQSCDLFINLSMLEEIRA